MVGWTAYFGAYNVSELKPEHVVVVSGAAGAVGSIFVQIAKKIVGCKTVIGIAGGKEKCDWVKSLGADQCIDYKASLVSKRSYEESLCGTGRKPRGRLAKGSSRLRRCLL